MISLKAIEEKIWVFTTTAQSLEDQADDMGPPLSEHLAGLYRASARTFRQCAQSLECMVTEEIANEAHDYLERT